MTAAMLIAFVMALMCGAVLLAAIVHHRRASVVAGPLLVVVGATVAWVALNLYLAAAKPAHAGSVAVWGLVAGALVAAGSRVAVAAVVKPRWRMTLRCWVLVSLHPVAAAVVAVVPEWRHLVFPASTGHGLGFGPLLAVHVALVIAIMGTAVVSMIRHRHRVPSVATVPGWLLAVAWVAPATSGALGALGWGPGESDLTPIGFVVACVVLWAAVLRPGLLELQPLARDWVFDRLADALFVVTVDGAVVDMNSSARTLMTSRGCDPRGRRVWLRDAYPELMDAMDAGRADGEEIELGSSDAPSIYSVTVSPIDSDRGVRLGALVQARDITDAALRTREAEATRLALEADATANALLREELAEQVMRDPATGLRNRRFIAANVPAMLHRAVTEHTPLSVIMLDVDHFKRINDDFGHSVGDRVIVAVADALQHGAPIGAEVARYGGEEFLVVLPGVGRVEAFEIAESLREACAAIEVEARDSVVRVKLSAGVSGASAEHDDAHDLIDDADVALYRAKQSGRDRTEIHEMPHVV